MYNDASLKLATLVTSLQSAAHVRAVSATYFRPMADFRDKRLTNFKR